MFNFKSIESKWQQAWQKDQIFQTNINSKKKKYYVLEMFPYPSASGLHMGHAFNYTIGDIFARFKRMQGFNVLYPMGFDSFGLPAENAAIKAKAHPKKFTEEAIKNYIIQMNKLGLSYDWSRMLITHNPDYYRWDQWIFLQMFKKGLAYKKEAPVNWCPECNTVLANEQVHNGKCWRHDNTNVEVKNLDQWFLKTTVYADELYENIDNLKEWPEVIKKLQKNWIGKSYGTEINFKINDKNWPIFTTRPDTLYGVTFMVISAQHPNLMELVTKEQKKEVEKFIKKVHSVSQEDLEKLEKEGVFTGSYATHPLTNEKLPVYAGNFVLASYGPGMVMAVPAHDQRDFEFAKKYKIPIRLVITTKNKKELLNAYTGEGKLINSGKFNGLNSEKAKQEITKYLASKKIGKKKVNYRLKDWLISRQRFWGTPIPIIKCEKCGIVPVPEKDLPILLPENIKLTTTEKVLENYKSFVETTCPKCKSNAKRETDTMDTFVNSSWYYLRYTDPKNNKKIFDNKTVDYWCPIDLYIGGKEHACMHLIYIRFYTKFLRDLGLLNFDEPAIKLFNQGMLQGPDGQKMSKSKGNVVLPEEVSKKYGIDTARMFLVSIANPDKDINWSDEGVEGSLRFVNKVVTYFSNIKFGISSKRVQHKVNLAIKEITEDIENLRYNIAVIKIRELFESFETEIAKEDAESFIKLLSPFCPHIAEELWSKIGNKNYCSLQSWPIANPKKVNHELDVINDFISNTIRDVNNIKKLVKTKPKKVTISVAENWKYATIEKIKREMEKDYNISRIIKEVILKEHSKEISKMVPSFTKNPTKLPKVVLSQEKEFKALKDNLAKLKEEFNLDIEIKKDDPKAIPGKPAILFE